MTTPNTIEQAVHAKWAADAVLRGQVPAGKVYTGRVPPGTPTPYVRVEFGDVEPNGRTSATIYNIMPVAFHVWVDTYGEGRAVLKEIGRVFAQVPFEWTGGGCSDMRFDGASSKQVAIAELKAWEHVLKYRAAVWEPRLDV